MSQPRAFVDAIAARLVLTTSFARLTLAATFDWSASEVEDAISVNREWEQATAHHLIAQCAASSEDPLTDYFRVGVAERRGFTGWKLMFHGGPADAAFTLPEEDYCLETESAAFTLGGLVSVELTEAVLRLRLTTPAVADLELPDPVVEITLDFDADAVRGLGEGLARVFAGTSSKNRPGHIQLPGASLSGYGHRQRRQREPKSARVEFDVIERRGQLLTVRSVDGTRTKSELPGFLGDRLGIDPEHVVGIRYSCLLTPDNWGTTYSDYRLARP